MRTWEVGASDSWEHVAAHVLLLKMCQMLRGTGFRSLLQHLFALIDRPVARSLRCELTTAYHILILGNHGWIPSPPKRPPKHSGTSTDLAGNLIRVVAGRLDRGQSYWASPAFFQQGQITNPASAPESRVQREFVKQSTAKRERQWR